MYNIPTYNEAVKLTQGKRYVPEIDQYLDAAFYEAKLVVDGYNVSIFNYRLATYNDFKYNDAFELRGLVYVFNEDGSVYKSYRLLHKFFNLNQVEETQYSLVKDRVVKSVFNKEDGSIGSFIKLPNGNVVAKSKMSFESDQAYGMNKIYNSNADIKRFVDWSLDNDLVAVFEYVAPHNRIVLKYDKEELILLRLRRNSTGEYLNLHDYSDVIGNLKTAESFDLSLDELVELAKTVEGVEGWVVDLDGLFVKIKTVWYCERHGLLTEDLYRENILVKYILDDKIDDVLGQIPEDEKEAHARIEKIIAAVSKAVKMKVDSILEDWKVFQTMADGKDWTGDLKDQLMRKSYAMKYKKTKNFGAVMSMAKGNDVYDIVTEQIAKETFRLQNARAFLFQIDPTLNFKDGEIED
jgi:T4 RnlA family RNA ligase